MTSEIIGRICQFCMKLTAKIYTFRDFAQGFSLAFPRVFLSEFPAFLLMFLRCC